MIGTEANQELRDDRSLDYFENAVETERRLLILNSQSSRQRSGIAPGPQPGEGEGPIQPAKFSVIDQTQLQSLRAVQRPGSSDVVTELIDLFLADASLHLGALRVALTKHDAFEIERLAHRLKGSSAGLGATRMSALCAELEGKESFEGAEGVMVQLDSEFELVREALQTERK